MQQRWQAPSEVPLTHQECWGCIWSLVSLSFYATYDTVHRPSPTIWHSSLHMKSHPSGTLSKSSKFCRLNWSDVDPCVTSMAPSGIPHMNSFIVWYTELNPPEFLTSHICTSTHKPNNHWSMWPRTHDVSRSTKTPMILFLSSLLFRRCTKLSLSDTAPCLRLTNSEQG